MKFLLFLFLLFSMIACNGVQNNWNQYLGPNRNATITGAEIMRSWPKEGPAKLWEFSLGSGYGGACTYDEEVFVLDRINGDTDVLRCF